jgi:glutaredoxin
MSEENKPKVEEAKTEISQQTQEQSEEKGEPLEIDLGSEEFKKKIEGKELWLVTAEGCGGCEDMRQILKEEGISYKEIKADEVPEIFNALENLKEENIPALLVARIIEGNKYLVCNVLAKEQDVCTTFEFKEKKV